MKTQSCLSGLSCFPIICFAVFILVPPVGLAFMVPEGLPPELRPTNATVRLGPPGEIQDAARLGNLEEVKKLLKDNPDLVFDTHGGTPLENASAYFGHKDIVEYLLAHKADVNAKGENGATALHWAVACNHKDIVEVLLANNADVNAKDIFGQTPLNWAVREGNKDVADLLRQHGGHE